MPEANATCNQCGYRGFRVGRRKWCPACHDGEGEPGELIYDVEAGPNHLTRSGEAMPQLSEPETRDAGTCACGEPVEQVRGLDGIWRWAHERRGVIRDHIARPVG